MECPRKGSLRFKKDTHGTGSIEGGASTAAENRT